MTEESEPSSQQKYRSTLISLLKYGLFFVVVYFGNQQLQILLGKSALAKVNMPEHSLSEAKQLAKEQDKPLLVDVSALWCPSCRKLDNEVLSQQTVMAAIKQRYIFVRLEYDSPEGQSFAKEHGIRGVPTLLTLEHDGSNTRKLPLTFKPEQFISLL